MKAAVLDSYAVIAYMQRQPGYEQVTRIFEECAVKDREAFLCVINWGEVIYHGLRTGGELKARLAEDTMRALPIILVEANKELTYAAARFKAKGGISYADCFAAALALKKKCELVTGDKEFKVLEGDVKMLWLKAE